MNERTDQRDLISLLHVLAGGRLPHFKTCSPSLARGLLPCLNAFFIIGRVGRQELREKCVVNVDLFGKWHTSCMGAKLKVINRPQALLAQELTLISLYDFQALLWKSTLSNILFTEIL